MIDVLASTDLHQSITWRGKVTTRFVTLVKYSDPHQEFLFNGDRVYTIYFRIVYGGEGGGGRGKIFIKRLWLWLASLTFSGVLIHLPSNILLPRESSKRLKCCAAHSVSSAAQQYELALLYAYSLILGAGASSRGLQCAIDAFAAVLKETRNPSAAAVADVGSNIDTRLDFSLHTHEPTWWIVCLYKSTTVLLVEQFVGPAKKKFLFFLLSMIWTSRSNCGKRLSGKRRGDDKKE